MPLPPHLANKIPIGLIFLVLAYSGRHGKDAVKWMSVCLIKLLLVKVSDRDRNVKGKNVGCAKLIVIFVIIYQPKNMFHDTLLVASCFSAMIWGKLSDMFVIVTSLF